MIRADQINAARAAYRTSLNDSGEGPYGLPPPGKETIFVAAWIAAFNAAGVDAASIREMQTSLPWTIRYSRDHRACPKTHKDFAHALHHVAKAAGKLHALADDMDHDREVADDPTLRHRHAKYVADLVVCALRMANVFPGGVIDLQKAVEDRIKEKNGPAACAVPAFDCLTCNDRGTLQNDSETCPAVGCKAARAHLEANKPPVPPPFVCLTCCDTGWIHYDTQNGNRTSVPCPGIGCKAKRLSKNDFD